MIDILSQIDAVHRELGRTGDAHRMLLRRGYDAAVEDVWDALTDAERISRWFLPVTGDLRLGGHYQLEGNAGGEILVCDAPKLLKVTWVYGEPTGISELEVRLTPSEDGTVLELEHLAEVPEDFWKMYGPGATGIGWELGLLGLREHLAGRDIPPEEKDALQQNPEMREFMTRSGHAWADVHRASGAPEEEVATALKGNLAAYVPDLD
jgi:uncharacterized protein YndB with AHSA1/START domain